MVIFVVVYGLVRCIKKILGVIYMFYIWILELVMWVYICVKIYRFVIFKICCFDVLY